MDEKKYNDLKEEIIKLEPKLKDVLTRIKLDLNNFKKNMFVALIGTIIGQKIRFTSARKIRSKLYSILGTDFTYKDITDEIDDKLLSIGISKSNLNIIKNVTNFIREKEEKGIEYKLDDLEDIKNIGKWTLNTVKLQINPLIDIFPNNDLFLQNKLRNIFNLEKRPTEKQTREITNKWKGYRGFITWHLWRDL